MAKNIYYILCIICLSLGDLLSISQLRIWIFFFKPSRYCLKETISKEGDEINTCFKVSNAYAII